MIHYDRVKKVRTIHIRTHLIRIAISGSSLAGNGGGSRPEHAGAEITSIDNCMVHHTARVLTLSLYCQTLQNNKRCIFFERNKNTHCKPISDLFF